jgi:hypothetical protein
MDLSKNYSRIFKAKKVIFLMRKFRYENSGNEFLVFSSATEDPFKKIV